MPPAAADRFTAPDESLPPAQRRAVVGAIVALHALLGYGALQVRQVREALAEASPLFVDLIALPAPEKPPEPPPPPPQPIAKTAPPAPPIDAASPEADAFVAPPPPPEPAAPVAAEAPAVVAAPRSSALPEPAPPKDIPTSAIAYLEPPAPVYPRASRRLNETGLVIVRVLVDVDGLPRTVQLLQSSGFARLDEAALEGVRQARFRPYSENGVPTAGWARIPIPFELE